MMSEGLLHTEGIIEPNCEVKGLIILNYSDQIYTKFDNDLYVISLISFKFAEKV